MTPPAAIAILEPTIPAGDERLQIAARHLPLSRACQDQNAHFAEFIFSALPRQHAPQFSSPTEKMFWGVVMKSLEKYNAQWAGHYAVASELARRGCLVSFTFGATPGVDLVVISPTGKMFKVDVKSQQGRSDWLIKPKHSIEDLFYVLAYVPVGDNRFFVLTQEEANTLVEENHKTRKLVAKSTLNDCCRFKDVFPYENAWDKLPQ